MQDAETSFHKVLLKVTLLLLGQFIQFFAEIMLKINLYFKKSEKILKKCEVLKAKCKKFVYNSMPNEHRSRLLLIVMPIM